MRRGRLTIRPRHGNTTQETTCITVKMSSKLTQMRFEFRNGNRRHTKRAANTIVFINDRSRFLACRFQKITTVDS